VISQNTSVRPSYLEVKNTNCDLPSTNRSAMGLNKTVFFNQDTSRLAEIKTPIKAKMMTFV